MVLRAPPCCSQPCQEASGFPGGSGVCRICHSLALDDLCSRIPGNDGVARVCCILWPRDCGASLADG